MADQADIMPQERLQRRLVTVRRISHMQTMKQDRRYQLAQVDGWTVVVPQGQFVQGQLVLYFEIDSFLPCNSDHFWEYTQGHTDELNGVMGYRLKSRTWGKYISQGAIFPLTSFIEINELYQQRIDEVGGSQALQDIMAMSFERQLGVQKWEVPFDQSPGANLGSPPSFVMQPGWERAQNVVGLFTTAQKFHATYQITEKLDGESMTVYSVNKGSRWYRSLPELPAECANTAMAPGHGRVGICSRTEDMIDNGHNLFWETAKKIGILPKLTQIGLSNVAVSGELIGSSIQANAMGFAQGEHTFIVFSIWDIDHQQYMQPRMVEAVCKQLNIHHTPVLGYCRLSDFAKTMEVLLQKAEGRGMNGTIQEGLVFKTMDGKNHFKVISNAWLIKTGK